MRCTRHTFSSHSTRAKSKCFSAASGWRGEGGGTAGCGTDCGECRTERHQQNEGGVRARGAVLEEATKEFACRTTWLGVSTLKLATPPHVPRQSKRMLAVSRTRIRMRRATVFVFLCVAFLFDLTC